jgi:GT2 family glycosyltransferase
MIDLSIIIVNYNSSDLLEQCLDSIYKHIKDIEFEVFVVDNASTDNSVEMVRTKFPAVKLIISKKNLYLTGGRNLALKKAQGKYVHNIAPDILYINNAPKKMIEFMEKHPEVGVLGPQVLNSDGSIQESGAKFMNILDGLWNFLMLDGVFGLNNPIRKRWHYYPWDRNTLKEVDVVTGCCLMFRRELLEKIGYWDENLLIYAEEDDWCKRVKSLGYKVVYYPEAKVIHHHAKGGTQALGRNISEKIYFNDLLYYYKKYYGSFIYIIFRMILSITLPLLFFFRRIKSWLFR